jgi:hypothetical protein
MSRALEITATAAHRDRFAHHSRAAAWMLAGALVALGACGTVDVAPSAKDGAGGNGVAGAGAPDGAAGGGGSFSAAGGAGGATVAAAGSSGEASSGGAAGSGGSGGATSAGTTGNAGKGGSSEGTGVGGSPGVSDVQCPYDVTVQRGCAGQIINGSPCDVCHDGTGALLHCSTDPRAGARMYCVPDCSYCHP